MLGAIAGQPVRTPPRSAIGHYLQPGDPEAILRWLASSVAGGVSAVVASTDMVSYGGLVASRIPGVSAGEAYARLRRLAALRLEHPGAFISVFGTIMRLAPTSVPDLGSGRGYYATGATVDAISAFANLPDPPRDAGQRIEAERLRATIGTPVLDAYLGTRARNREVDRFALQLTAEGHFDRIVLGQDDAGPQGLHLRDVAALTADVARYDLAGRASIEPGADELGMVLLAQAFARAVGWRPVVRVVYSRSDGASVNDRLEYVPIDATISRLIAACGGRRNDVAADMTLFVRVAGTSDADESAFADAIAAAVTAKLSVAVADLTFLNGASPSAEQQALTKSLIDRGLAGKLDAFASWNTTANTVGTALAAAIAVGAGKRSGRYDARAHAQFMLDRYIDDFAFHQFVRPVLNADLRGRGIDVTLLMPPVASEAASKNRALLWPYALDLLAQIYPQYHDGGLIITLPWDRTFETAIDVRLR